MKLGKIMEQKNITSKKLAELTGISRRTIEGYRGTDPKQIDLVNAVLIADALEVDIHLLVPQYRVTLIGDRDETELLVTYSKEEAIETAKYSNSRGGKAEIRIPVYDWDDEECDCYDYDVLKYEQTLQELTGHEAGIIITGRSVTVRNWTSDIIDVPAHPIQIEKLDDIRLLLDDDMYIEYDANDDIEAMRAAGEPVSGRAYTLDDGTWVISPDGWD